MEIKEFKPTDYGIAEPTISNSFSRGNSLTGRVFERGSSFSGGAIDSNTSNKSTMNPIAGSYTPPIHTSK
jgi:hypothetical protein